MGGWVSSGCAPGVKKINQTSRLPSPFRERRLSPRSSERLQNGNFALFREEEEVVFTAVVVLGRGGACGLGEPFGFVRSVGRGMWGGRTAILIH